MAAPFSSALAEALRRWPQGFSFASIALRSPPDGDHTLLRVAGDGTAELDLTRAAYDAPMPIGRFAGQLPPELPRALAEALAPVEFETLKGLTPAGGNPHVLEVVAAGRAILFPVDALFARGEVGNVVLGLLARGISTMLEQPAAALSLDFGRRNSRLRLTIRRMGDAPLIIGNPMAGDGPSAAFCKLQLLRPLGPEKNFIWDSFDVPLEGTAFAASGRRFPMEAREITVDFDDPTGGALAAAPAARVLFGDPVRPPGLRLAGIDVFGRVVSSNVVDPATSGAAA